MWRLDKIRMKFNDEYFVWAVVLAVVVFVLVYSLSRSKEEFITKCWSPETSMSAATGYPTDDGNQGFQSYIKYVGNELKKYGKCPLSENSFNCLNAGLKEGLQSIDMAKSYCSTVNCTAIFVVKGHPYGGTIYVPATSAFSQALPRGSDGKQIPVDKLPTMILPTQCGSTQQGVITAQPGNPLIQTAITTSDTDWAAKVLPPYESTTSSPATDAIAALSDPGDAYIRKSSLVPCTCTKHSMGCERHGGGKDSSKVPGDKDGAFADGNSDQTSAQDQKGLMRPFSKAFEEQGEPTGFLNSFDAFG